MPVKPALAWAVDEVPKARREVLAVTAEAEV